MSSFDLCNQIKLENLYSYVLNLHYERCPVFSKENLEKAKNYILDQLESFGLIVTTHDFTLPGSDLVYSNVIGSLSSADPELLVTSHYDHINRCIGADDNLSAVAIMLEVARVLSEANVDKPIQFISFTLEEQNPVVTEQLHVKAKELGLVTESGIPITHQFRSLLQRAFHEENKLRLSPREEINSNIYSLFEDELNDPEKEYFRFRADILSNPIYLNWINFMYLHGSAAYVGDLHQKETTLRGVINLETCGYTSQSAHSQLFPPGMDPSQFPSYKIDDPTIGNFVSIVSDQQSIPLGQKFFQATQTDYIDLQSLLIAVPLPYDQIYANMYDLLRSDHTPFWKANIPALMITDGANFRTPYYHTPGDTIDKLDFDFMTKIAKTTLQTVLEY